MILRALRALSVAAALVVTSSVAGAGGATSGTAPPGTPPPRALALDAVPVMGPDAPGGERWLGTVVRLTNFGEQQVEGNVELTSELPWSKDDRLLITRAPFAVAGKQRVTLQLPTHGFFHSAPQLRVRALDGSGKELGSDSLPDPRPIEPLLFDLNVPSRLAPGVRGMRVAAQYTAPLGPSYRYSAPALSVGSPPIDAATGDPVLPDRAAGYAAASVVLAKSATVTALQGPELDALVNWVLGGGALAIVVSRPEDLRAPALTAMAGGEIELAPPPPKMKAEAEFVVPTDTGGGYGYGYSPRYVIKRASPSSELVPKLQGYRGGNLRASPWGASASYGLGEIHLLAFDATAWPVVNDEWVKLEIVDLVRHSWDRQVTIALPHGTMPMDLPNLDEIRKLLDPNEGARWAIVVALLLLIAYAVLAGPLNFHLASKKGKPLSALWHLPIWAGATMVGIVVLGAAARGVSGRARHLSLIEAGGGASRGAITRFRGFYTSAAEQLLVRGSERGDVLDVAGDASETARQLVVDRDGARLEKFQAKPWQTVLVREDGFTSLGGGVSLVERGADVEVTNRMARDLLAVIVRRPRGDAFYFPRIPDGKSVLATSGKPLGKTLGHLRYFGSIPVRDLGSDAFAATLSADVKGAGEAWRALDALVKNSVSWWPDDVPVVIGQLEGGEGRTTDAGLRIESDRVLCRFVGWGGVP
jgi:hypothetical protein